VGGFVYLGGRLDLAKVGGEPERTDINGDGMVTVFDALALLKAIINHSGITNCFIADINGDEAITLVEASKWYELFLSVLSIVFVVIWGNSTTLCKIFPILGGAIGYRLGGGYTYTLVLGGAAGAICGVAVVLSLIFMKKAKKPMNKILIGLGFDVAAILINALLAFVLIMNH
jgi:hypothetical protein